MIFYRWRHGRAYERGFTLVELAVSTAFIATAALWASKWIGKPALVQNLLLTVDMQRQADEAANQFVTDFQNVDPTSFSWSALPPTSPGLVTSLSAMTLPTYSMNSATPTPAVSIQYSVVSSGNGQGNLIRVYNGNTTRVLLQNVITPTASFPLVQQDTSTYNMLVFSFAYQPPAAHAPITVTKRVAVTG